MAIATLGMAPTCWSATSFRDLAKWCSSIPIVRLEDAFRAGRCIGYLAGAPDGIELGEEQMQRALRPQGGHWIPMPPCIPDEVTNDQIAQMIVKYAAENPHLLHLPGAVALQRMTREAFPCIK